MLSPASHPPSAAPRPLAPPRAAPTSAVPPHHRAHQRRPRAQHPPLPRPPCPFCRCRYPLCCSPQRRYPPRRPIKPRIPSLHCGGPRAQLARIAPYASPFPRMRAISPLPGSIFASCMLFGVKMARSSPHVSISGCDRAAFRVEGPEIMHDAKNLPALLGLFVTAACSLVEWALCPIAHTWLA